MMIATDRVVDPAGVLVERLVVVEREHLGLLVILILLVLFAVFKWCLLLLRFPILSSTIILLLLFIFLVKEGEIVRILAFALARIGIVRLVVLSVRCLLLVVIVVHLQELLLLLFLAVRGRALFVTDGLVTLITNKYAIARIGIIIIRVLAVVAWYVVVARPVLLADAIIIPKGSGCRGNDS